MTKVQYEERARIVVRELFPNLSKPAADALVFLIADFLLSLYAMSESQ